MGRDASCREPSQARESVAERHAAAPQGGREGRGLDGVSVVAGPSADAIP